MKRRKQIKKSETTKADGDKIFRLTEIDPEFVSLVRAGANRQKSFMVIKDDGEVEAEKVIPGLVPSPRTPGPKCPNCGAKLPMPLPSKCPNCGFNLKEAEGKKDTSQTEEIQAGDDSENPGESAANTDTGKSKSTEDETPSNAQGDSAEQVATDLASWLDEAGTKVQDLSLDIAIQRALDGQSKSGADVGAEEQMVQEVDSTDAPAVEDFGEEVEKQSDGRDSRIAKLEHDLGEARLEVKRLRRERTALQAKNARLSKGVGKSSVMLTGEVTTLVTNKSEAIEKSPSRGAFLSGGDIAAAVVDE